MFIINLTSVELGLLYEISLGHVFCSDELNFREIFERNLLIVLCI